MCIAKQIFNEKDLSAIVELLSGLIKIVTLSEEKDQKIQKNKKKKKKDVKINTHLRTVEDFDKLTKVFDSVFKTDQ